MSAIGIDAYLNGSKVASFTSLAPFMQYVAASYSVSSSPTYVANQDGTDAIKLALDCLFSGGHATFSGVYLNQTYPNFQVVAHGVVEVDSSGNVLRTYDFSGFGDSCSSSHPLLFTSTDATQTIDTVSFGSDWYVNLVTVGLASACKDKGGQCTNAGGSCLATCLEDGSTYCECSEDRDSCETHDGDSVASGYGIGAVVEASP